MKTMKFAAVVLALGAMSTAQAPDLKEKLKDPLPSAPAPQKITIPPSAAKDALYAAIHKRDQADKALSDLNLQLANVQAAAAKQYEAISKQQTAAAAEVAKAEDAVYRAMGLDKAKFTLDDEKMELTEKAKTAMPEQVQAGHQ
jgi:hypothetical protein